MTYIHTFVGLLVVTIVAVVYSVSGGHTLAGSEPVEPPLVEQGNDHKSVQIVIRNQDGSLDPYGTDATATSVNEEAEIEEVDSNSPEETDDTEEDKTKVVTHRDGFNVPFYSQFKDITDASWQKVGCGIASLAMVIDLYEPGQVSVDNLLRQGIDSGAYLQNAGWIHQGLIDLAGRYGLSGNTRDLSGSDSATALSELEKALERSPVIASVHYTFEPTNPIPHLVVVSGIEGDTVFYNDPAEPNGGGTISSSKFLSAWKKRYIAIYPAT